MYILSLKPKPKLFRHLKPYEKLKVDTADDSQIGNEENNESDTTTDIPIIDILETKPDRKYCR